MTPFEITQQTAGNELSPDQQEIVVALALKVLGCRIPQGEPLSSPTMTRQYLRVRTGGYRYEVFGCIFLDTRHRVIRTEELFNGTIDSAAVYPRVVLQRAMELDAAAVVLFHNHPSGVAEPSAADHAITRRLKDALGLVDIRVLDHLILTPKEDLSMAERGIL